MKKGSRRRGFSAFILKYLGIIIPSVIAAISLTFNVFQYFDSKNSQAELNDLRAKELRRLYRADISTFYIETGLESLQMVDRKSGILNACSLLVKKIEKNLRTGIHYSLVGTPAIWDLEEYVGRDIRDHSLKFLVVHNTGQSKVTDVKIRLKVNEEISTVTIGELEINRGVLILIQHFNPELSKDFSPVWDPIDIAYIDTFLGLYLVEEIRDQLPWPIYLYNKSSEEPLVQSDRTEGIITTTRNTD